MDDSIVELKERKTLVREVYGFIEREEGSFEVGLKIYQHEDGEYEGVWSHESNNYLDNNKYTSEQDVETYWRFYLRGMVEEKVNSEWQKIK